MMATYALKSMLKLRLLVFPCSFLAFTCEQHSSTPPLSEPGWHVEPGQYVGMKYMGIDDITPDDSTDKWYHENTVTVRADSLFLESVPVVFYKNQPKAYSSSDGGFYFYRGKLYRQGNQLIAKLLLLSHDYVAPAYLVPDSVKAKADLNISFEEKVKRGIYVVDSSFFKKQWLLVKSPKGFTLDSVAYSRTTKH